MKKKQAEAGATPPPATSATGQAENATSSQVEADETPAEETEAVVDCPPEMEAFPQVQIGESLTTQTVVDEAVPIAECPTKKRKRTKVSRN